MREYLKSTSHLGNCEKGQLEWLRKMDEGGKFKFSDAQKKIIQSSSLRAEIF